jgi:hypothetical protein
MPGSDPVSGDRSRVRSGEQGRAGSAALAAAALIALQGLGLAAAGVFLIVRALGPDAHHRGSTEVLGALSVVVGIGVLALARSVRAGRRRFRSLLLVMEILCLPIAVTSIQGGRWYIGGPLALVALAVIVLLGAAGLLTPGED